MEKMNKKKYEIIIAQVFFEKVVIFELNDFIKFPGRPLILRFFSPFHSPVFFYPISCSLPISSSWDKCEHLPHFFLSRKNN